MRIITDIEHTPEEIYGMIESVTVLKDNWFAEHVTDTKVFQGYYISKGMVIAPLREKDDSLRGNNYWFFVYVKDGYNGNAKLIMHVFPSIIHLFLLLMLVTSLLSWINGGGAQFMTLPASLFIIAINIREYVKTKKLLFSTLSDNMKKQI